MGCGHRDDSVRVGWESFLEGSHGDPAHVVNDELRDPALHMQDSTAHRLNSPSYAQVSYGSTATVQKVAAGVPFAHD